MKISKQSKIIVGVFFVTFVALIFHLNAKVKRDHLTFYEEKFQLLGALRKSALQAYFDTIKSELNFWVESDMLEKLGLEVDRAWYEIQGDRAARLRAFYANKQAEQDASILPDDMQNYASSHNQLHALAADFVKERHYHDFFLIDLKGNVIYTVQKESDYAGNVVTGELKNTNLAKAFHKALDDKAQKVHFVDFENYPPNNNEPAMFASKTMHDANGNIDGVVAIELDVQSIHEIMSFTSGMGKSGETYLVGEDGLMRSNSRFSEESTVLKTSVTGDTVSAALNNETGVRFVDDYRGITVLSAFDHIDLDGFKWALMAEIDKSEILETNPVSPFYVALVGLFTFLVGLIGTLVVNRFAPSEELAEDLAESISSAATNS